jgi:hypothetical protein
MQEELEGLHRARVSIYEGGWGWRREGRRWVRHGGRAEEIGEGGGVGDGTVAHRDRAESAVQPEDQQLRACASAAVVAWGTGGGSDKR